MAGLGDSQAAAAVGANERHALSLAAWADVLLTALLASASVLLPLVFFTGVEDTFALPKAIGLRVAVIAALIPLAMRFLSSGIRGMIRPGWLDVALLVYVALNVAALAASVDRTQSFFGERLQWQGLLTILLYVASFYLARMTFLSERRFAVLFGAVGVAGAVAGAYALLQRAGGDPIWDALPQGRVTSTLGQPNWLAAFLLLAIPSLAVLAWRCRRRWTVWMIIGGVLAMVAALAFTMSRAGYLAFVAAALVVAVVTARRWRVQSKDLRAAAVVLVAAVVAGALLAPAREAVSEVWDRARSAAELDSFDIRQHLALWEVGTAIAIDHPLLGAGQETYPLLFDGYRDATLDPYHAEALRHFRPESPHNVYLATAAGAGFPALAAYLAIIGGVVVMFTRAIRSAATTWTRLAFVALLATVTGHVVTDAFMTAEVAGSWTFWVLMGAGVGLAHTEAAGRVPGHGAAARGQLAQLHGPQVPP